jgi:putative ABC transport system substrate-binding protein
LVTTIEEDEILMSSIGRRKFIAMAGGTVLALPRATFAEGQPGRPLIAWLSPGTKEASMAISVRPFLKGMQESGYVEGRDFEMVYRFSEGHQEQLPALSEEIVRLNPSVIVTPGLAAAVSARKVTSTIPIVCPTLADGVQLGLIASEARPGGNVTGIEPYVAGLPAKQMEIAREVVAGASKIGLLTNLTDPKAPPQATELEAAGKSLELKVVSADANQPNDLDRALQVLAGERVDVVIVLQTSMLWSEARQIASLTLAKKLPTVYGYREHVLAGGLISYGVDLRWCDHRAAYFVDKILHGILPKDLPVEFPTTLWLSINRTTARALGITVPPLLLSQADEVIE